MTNRSRALRTSTILWWGAGLIAVAAAAALLLLTTLGGGSPQDTARLDALRTAANVVVGTGGAAALLLAARRQRSAELDLEQKDHDATQRRFTDTYSKAADQLGSDKAPVRFAGLYALERLAQEYPEQRQTIVNLFCAYLRMPFDPEDPSTGTRQETEVRSAAQRILCLHLRPGRNDDNAAFWPDVDLDFSGARLVRLSLTRCRIRSIACYGTTFVELAEFTGTEITSKAEFPQSRFLGLADFRGAVFGGTGDTFTGAAFEGPSLFGDRVMARLCGATTRTDVDRSWPPGWAEKPIEGWEGHWAALVPEEPASPPPA
ncbi:pentapeptide repeat-containing protein [Amycolatopsis sp. FDAARGOS 1241]|uniref:pentapeptide repeat-containing protein n=1 Tax=Amycolatopsis sp. FDAARGOS 1241 TaxID=2778070 RepID=UPI001EF26F58|nr:pentapeptide repeat-containing protein [Amycolatopsis sp. FDAARGOS 1241]